MSVEPIILHHGEAHGVTLHNTRVDYLVTAATPGGTNTQVPGPPRRLWSPQRALAKLRAKYDTVQLATLTAT